MDEYGHTVPVVPSRFYGEEARAREVAAMRPERQFVALTQADIAAMEPHRRAQAEAALANLLAAR